MSAAAKPLPAKPAIAKITSKGQITIPVEIRRLLGANTGDKLAFEPMQDGVRVVRQGEENPFEKYRGTWEFDLPPGYEGRDGVIRYVREMRGHDEFDELLYEQEQSSSES
jgi:antitoxin PrlF